jgi:hypothetical protein
MANIALPNTPDNQNFLHPNKFHLTFSRVPNVQFFCQSVSVPGISLGEIAITTPFVEMYSPGEKAIYDIMNVTFAIDEKMSSWLEIHNWIRGMTFPENFDEYKNLSKLSKYTNKIKPQFSDATLTVYSSSFTPIVRFNFFDAFPTSLSSFVLSTQDTTDTILTADASIRFTYYNIEKLI